MFHGNILNCLVNRTNLVHTFLLICLLLFSTCFGQLCAHHQEKIPYLCDTWYFSLYVMTVWYAGRNADSLPYRMTNTSCRIGTVFSPDDGHIVARNLKRKAINILRKNVWSKMVLFTRLYKDARSTKHFKKSWIVLQVSRKTTDNNFSE
jgi:hypothetical protein